MKIIYRLSFQNRLRIIIGLLLSTLVLNVFFLGEEHIMFLIPYLLISFILHSIIVISKSTENQVSAATDVASQTTPKQQRVVSLKAIKNSSTKAPKPTQPRLQASISDDRYAIQAGDTVVLVVEDDPFFAKLLLNNIQSKGFKGVVANQGNLVISYIQKYRPKAILLDINLPKVDGWAILKIIKDNPQFGDIPVHIISGVDDPKKGINMGASTYLVKPIVPEKLHAILEKIETSVQSSIKNIAIVSDKPSEPTLIEETLLQDKLHNNVITSKSSELLDILSQTTQKIHCIIIDVEDTNKQSYLTMLATLKSHEIYKYIPRIILTNDESEKRVISFFKKYVPFHQVLEQDPNLQVYIGKTNDFLGHLQN